MPTQSSSFTRYFLGNIRLSAIVCAIVTAGLAFYAVITDGEMLWEVVVFLSIGMIVSSLLNAWTDARRNRHVAG